MHQRCRHCMSILDPSWRYCVTCGATTAALDVSEDEVLLPPMTLEGEPQRHRRAVRLHNRGYAGARLRASVADGPEWAAVVVDHDVRVDPGASTDVALDLEPPIDVAGEYVIKLMIESDDGPRSAVADGRVLNVTWSRPDVVRRVLFARIELVPSMPVEIDQELLVFSHRLRERTLRLRNPNAEAMSVTVTLPKGVEAEGTYDDALTVPPRNGHLDGTLDFALRVDPARLSRTAQAQARDVVVVAQDLEHHARVHFLDEGGTGSSVPLVVGIDFGTDNTSVFAREPGTDEGPVPVPILGEHEPRVPSYIVYEGSDPVPKFYGTRAKDVLVQPENLRAGYRIEYDVKRWLQFADEDESRRTVLRDYLKRLYQDIDSFLEARGLADHTGVQFVFTLPVLDQGQAFETQRRVMHEVVMEVFGPRIQRGLTVPEDITYVLEPQAAAACFLFDEDVLTDLGLPGYEKGDLVAVVDSGAGTTDLALVQVTGERGIHRFDVLAVYGTSFESDEVAPDHDLGRFGGRWVDDQLYDLMIGTAADVVNRARPNADVTTDDMRNYLEEALREAGLEHRAPEKYVERVKPRLFAKRDPDQDVKLRQEPNIRDKVMQQSIDREQYLPAFVVTLRSFEERVRREGVLERLRTTLEHMLREGVAADRIQSLPFERRHLRYIFAVGGNSHLPQLRSALEDHFPGATVVPFEPGSEGGQADDEAVDFDESSIRMTAVARGSVWSVGLDAGRLMPFRLTLRSAEGRETVLMRENSPFTMRLPVQAFQFRPGQPYEAMVFAGLPTERLRLGRIRYDVASDDDVVLHRTLQFELGEDWILRGVVRGGGSDEEVFRYALR